MSPLGSLYAAFDYLSDLIDKGMEYPDAEWKAWRKFNVESDDLRALYDHETSTAWALARKAKREALTLADAGHPDNVIL
jgi:hypothetical protein